jgi:hypothetical protein
MWWNDSFLLSNFLRLIISNLKQLTNSHEENFFYVASIFGAQRLWTQQCRSCTKRKWIACSNWGRNDHKSCHLEAVQETNKALLIGDLFRPHSLVQINLALQHTMRIEQLDIVSSRSMKETFQLCRTKEEKTIGETGNRVVREVYPGNFQYSTQWFVLPSLISLLTPAVLHLQHDHRIPPLEFSVSLSTPR